MKKESKILIGLENPCAPYFASAYNTLLSIVQSITMGLLINDFYEKMKKENVSFFIKFAKDKDFLSLLENLFTPSHNLFINLVAILKSLIIFYVICFIWHRYVSHTQFIAWRLNMFDTVVPMVFAVLQAAMIKTILISDNLILFAISFTFIFVCGFFAYLNSDIQHKKEKKMNTLFLFQFKDQNFARILYDEIAVFESKEKYHMLYVACIILLVLFLNLIAVRYSSSFFVHAEADKIISSFSLIAFLMLLYYLSRRDLVHALNKSNALNEYFESNYLDLEKGKLF